MGLQKELERTAVVIGAAKIVYEAGKGFLKLIGVINSKKKRRKRRYAKRK